MHRAPARPDGLQERADRADTDHMRRLVLLTTRSTVLALAAVLALSLPACQAEATVPRSQPLAVGAHVHATWSSYDADTRAEVFDRLADAGATWVRIDIGWASLENACAGCRQEWHVQRVGEILDEAAAHGLSVLGVLWRTPSWANDGDVLAPPDDPDDYARAARWIAETYAGRVAAWEVWNEPNLDDFWHGSVDAYVDLLKAAAPAIRAGDPDARVVLGGPSKNDTRWLQAVYERGAAGSFDVLATHPYMTPADAPPETPDGGDDIGTLEHVEAVRDLMVRHGDGALPIWFTEFGWSAHATEPDAPAWRRGVSEQQQADYLVRALDMIEQRWPYVTTVFWYGARDQQSGDPHLDGYGLLRHDLTPKPAYDALAEHRPSDGADDLLGRLPDNPDLTDTAALVDRVAGADRIATSVAVAEAWDAAEDVLLATARNFPDALAAGALGARLDAPLLLTEPDRVPPAVLRAIARLGTRRVHVLGGPAAVGDAVTRSLRAGGLQVVRHDGASRFETAAAIARAAGAPSRRAAVVLGRAPDPARDAWPDALAAGALAASPDRLPTLLVEHDDLPAVTITALHELGVTHVTVVGGQSAVSEAVLRRLRGAGFAVDRLAGESRYATSAAAVHRAMTVRPPTRLVLATGEAFPDGLAATALAAHLGGTVALAPRAGLEGAPDLTGTLDDIAVPATLVGGESALSARLAEQVHAALRR